MSTPENPPNTNGAPTILGQNFTAREARSLHDLRAQFRTHAEHDPATEQDPRFEFARWLIEHGKLTDAR
jgi:hypothetical protein